MEDLKSIKKWNKYHALILLISGILGVYFHTLPILLMGAGISFIWYIIDHWATLQSFKPFAGYANWVTLFRLGLIFFTGIMFEFWPYVLLFIPIVIIASLDGVDGYLARKHNQSSDFGGYLDMESDTFYVCLLCTAYFLDGVYGPWILLVGYLRYLYVGFLYAFHLQNKKEKSTRFAKTIAVTLFIALMFPLLFPITIHLPIVVSASFLVIYSFGVSFFSLFQS